MVGDSRQYFRLSKHKTPAEIALYMSSIYGPKQENLPPPLTEEARAIRIAAGLYGSKILGPAPEPSIRVAGNNAFGSLSVR